MRYLMLLISALPLIGCATIIEGGGQSVAISTTPAGAMCSVDRAGTHLADVAATPGSVRIDKSKNDLTIACSKPGFQKASITQTPKFVGTTFGNILVGGVVGVVVDAASGANYVYPAEVKLEMAAATEGGVPASETSANVPAVTSGAPTLPPPGPPRVITSEADLAPVTGPVHVKDGIWTGQTMQGNCAGHSVTLSVKGDALNASGTNLKFYPGGKIGQDGKATLLTTVGQEFSVTFREDVFVLRASVSCGDLLIVGRPVEQQRS